jgi:predicted glycosyltransferase
MESSINYNLSLLKSQKMLHIIFYFNHYNTLGHSIRVFSLVKGLKEYFKEKIKIIVLQGGKRQYILPFTKYARLYILPYSIDKRGLFIEESINIYKKMISSGKIDNMLKERLSFIKNIIDKFRPNIFITEYFPFGQEFWTFEMPYILRYLKDNFDCKIVGSSGYLSWITNTYDYIKEFYDFLFIHSPIEFCKDYHLYLPERGSLELDRVLTEFANKIYFTNFVLEKTKTNDCKIKRDRYLGSGQRKLILVSRGGGILNIKILLTSIITAKRNQDLFFLIACGPATTVKEFTEYNKLAKGINNVKIIKVIAPTIFDSYLKAADLNVNMAGYNTTVRLLYYGKKSILVPYHKSTEQIWRADLAKKYLPSRIILEKDLNIAILEKNIWELLEDKNNYSVKIDRDWFSGVFNTIQKLRCLI